MYRDKERYGQEPTTVLRSKPKTFNAPLSWDHPNLVFTCSWSDFFIEEADEWRPEAWKIIKDTPHLTYQILTKRPERIQGNLPPDWGIGYPNVWIGVSVENQDTVNRINHLSRIPATVRFVSFEPLIGEVDLEKAGITPVFFDWGIIGGESGNEAGKYRYRECSLEWIKALIEFHRAWCIPVFVKQLGSHLAKEEGLRDRFGGDISEWDAKYQIREFPKA